MFGGEEGGVGLSKIGVFFPVTFLVVDRVCFQGLRALIEGGVPPFRWNLRDGGVPCCDDRVEVMGVVVDAKREDDLCEGK